MNLLLKYWTQTLAALVGFSLAAVMFGWVYDYRTGKADAAHQKELQAQSIALQAQCAEDKQITEDISREYQGKIATLNSRVAALKRVQPTSCVPVSVADAAGQYDGAAGDSRFPLAHGVTSDALYNFAGDAEQVGLQLDACQKFTSDVRNLNQQRKK